MDPVIDKILTDLKAEYGVSKYELEKILDSELKVTLDHIQSRNLKTVHWIHLGTISPSAWFKYHQTARNNKENELLEEAKTDI